MLPKGKRINKKEDFSKIQRYGRRVADGNLQVRFLEKEAGPARVGFLVGIKFSKSAVERNTLKRKLREILKKELKTIKPGTSIVVSARGKADRKETSRELQKTIRELLQKSNLIQR